MTLIKCRHCSRCYDVDVDTVMIVCPVCMETVYDIDTDYEADRILQEASQYGNNIK